MIICNNTSHTFRCQNLNNIIVWSLSVDISSIKFGFDDNIFYDENSSPYSNFSKPAC